MLAQEWILKGEAHDPTDLEDPGEGWVSIDRELAAALTKIARDELGRQITQAGTIALSNNTVARGRVLLSTACRYYASGNNALVLYDIIHLQKLTLKEDNFDSFHNTWTMVLSELSEPPDPKLLLHLYFKQVQHFKLLDEDVSHYKRAKYLGLPDHTFEWLGEASNRYLLMKRTTCRSRLVGAKTGSPSVLCPRQTRTGKRQARQRR